MYGHIFIFVLRMFSSAKAADHWSYEGENGIETWTRLDLGMKNECGGKQQSPIDIQRESAVYRKMPPLHFHGYHNELKNVTAVINHEQANIVNVGRHNRYISGGPLAGRYNVYGFHFHWGRQLAKGSEHAIDGQKFPLEMHIVHFKEEYGTFENARHYPDGLCVLAVSFQSGDPWDTSKSEFGGFATWRQEEAEERLTSFFRTLSRRRSEVQIWRSGFKLADLLPLEPQAFFSYHGSLTTPGCNEAVTWIVFSQRVPIANRLLRQFHRLRDSEGSIPKRNWRPLQPLNGRTIYKSFQTFDDVYSQLAQEAGFSKIGAQLGSGFGGSTGTGFGADAVPNGFGGTGFGSNTAGFGAAALNGAGFVGGTDLSSGFSPSKFVFGRSNGAIANITAAKEPTTQAPPAIGTKK